MEAPMIVCPDDIRVPADDRLATRNVSWPSPTAMDNFRVVALNATYANGSQFMIGSETVVYTAFDPQGNTGICNFTVTVFGKAVSCVCAFKIENIIYPNSTTLFLQEKSPKWMCVFDLFQTLSVSHRTHVILITFNRSCS